MQLLVPSAIGCVLDRLTILEIKAARLADARALANVCAERAALRECWSNAGLPDDVPELSELMLVNRQLWDIEDALRERERSSEFDIRFVELARSVYQLNDRRAQLKRAINERFKSTLREEKSHGSHE
jgi:hypothetical protein